MKRYLLTLSLITVLGLSPLLGHADSVRLASGEWPPYQSENLKYSGVASRIVTEAFLSQGIDTEYGYFPWANSLQNAKSGKWDGTFLWFDTPKRRESFFVSDPILDVQYVFFYKKNYNFDWKTISDLKGVKIGGTIDYDYGKSFGDAEKEKLIDVVRASSDKVNFKKLLAGRIQIFPCDLDAGMELLNNSFHQEEVSTIKYHKRPVKAAPHHLLLSKMVPKNQDRMDKFNKGLKELRESGKIALYLNESRAGLYKTQ
ncbi:MAG: transporter substrate-binding domain-containing protein [Thermodesulfobacteriota bacterium]